MFDFLGKYNHQDDFSRLNITKQLPSSDIKTQTFHSHENIKSKIEKNHLDGIDTDF
jgi:hypothetical protein